MAYQAVNAVFLQLDPQLSAAEAHGMAVGMLCVNSKVLSSYWLHELTDASAADENPLLTHLFEETRQLLASDGFEFDLLLPDDEMLLNGRVAALKNWCLGFLFGVGASHPVAGYGAEIREILQDITEITKLDNEAEGEEDEQAYTEITEYLRAAVLVLRDEFGGQNPVKLH